MLPPMKKLIEASYLTADNAAEYRTILRYFYIQHERMRDFIATEEVLEYFRSIPHYAYYEEEQLMSQLAQLVKWGNLSARQDMTNAKTIEEYKKKRFRYQPTPYTIEIERMVATLEKKSGETFGGSLEKSLFDRLLEGVQQLHHVLEKQDFQSTESSMILWGDILQYFQKVRSNTADYIAYINSEQTDQRMQSEAFLVYKNQFTVYLRDFIVSLQKTSLQIADYLLEMNHQRIAPFFDELVLHQKQVPRLEALAHNQETEWHQEYHDTWSVVRAWFIGAESQKSELEMLQIQTNEMIRRITRSVQRMTERHHSQHSRKKDYSHLAHMFYEVGTLNEAHKLSAVVFGAMTIRHIKMEEATTENIYVDIWDEEPLILPIRPRIREYREKTRPNAMIVNQEKKKALMEEHLAEQEMEHVLITRLFKEHQLRLSELDLVEPFIRKVCLNWIAKAVTNEERLVKTDYGFTLHMQIEEKEWIELSSEDGTLRMPNVIFEKRGERVGSESGIR
ncbi:uncharacterized protein (TIGR02677 family) [Chryseomicrobium aureum]|uniref:TIGR02677 family protein n=1 Tax=Chryseomicrobium aureum TaxID=1441723 RepID=UPI001959D7FE|nr:TIGR02677 family protein [Chryseomicrobium aureum]MBM7706420.1 uncharacterized protein (TIGR02677 family) [Chryseomicrobium aureum]